MKKGLLVLIMMISVGIMAQHPNRQKRDDFRERHHQKSDFTPQQMAELKSKQMTLHLDLNDKQQRAVKKLILSQAEMRQELMDQNKEDEKLSRDEMFEIKSKLLDEKIKAKNEMKSILTEEQFQKWEKRTIGKKGLNRKHPKQYKQVHNN